MSIRPTAWRRIRRLFTRTLDMDPDKRAGFLARLRRDDPALADALVALLDADTRAGRWLEGPPPELRPLLEHVGRVGALEPLSAALTPGGILEPGDRIGPWAVVRDIGRGGMSTVYLAERADEQFRQRVAIKLIRRGMDTADILGRFRAERQILADLHHPGVARLLDGGMSPDGRPYLVMEYVDGEPIDRYCERRRLSVGGRLAVFRAVCAAVQHAHRNLVVHRDLKPGNILITPEGVPKLLDFGIAKLLRPDPSGDAARNTRPGMRLLSPEYASPEQVRGERITTATDVYALGVVLYELLSGRHPQPIERLGLAELERRVCEEDPPKPSAAADEARVRRRLAGDLDNIVMKAMHKDPERRYASAEQLREDIGRHVTGLPVLARRDTLSYRTMKFVRRHAVGVAACTLVALSLVAGLAGTTWQARQAAEAERVARVEAAKASRVSLFLEGLLRELSFHEMRAAGFSVEDILDGRAAVVEPRFTGQPGLQAELLEILGRVYLDWNHLERAQPLLERSLDLRRGEFGDQHPDVARSLGALGLLHWKMGDYREADRHYERALATGSALLGGDHPDVATTLHDYGMSLHDQGRFAAAERLYRRALAIREQELGPTDRLTIASMNGVAAALRDQGDYDPATELFERVLVMRRARHGDRHPNVATTMHNLGFVYARTGEFAAAERLHREALAVRREWFGEDDRLLGNSLHNLATLFRRMGEYDSAGVYYRRALDLRRAQLGNDHPQTAMTLAGMGRMLLEVGDAAAAEHILREALAIRRVSLGDENWLTTDVLSDLRKALVALGRHTEAESLLTAASSTRTSPEVM